MSKSKLFEQVLFTVLRWSAIWGLAGGVMGLVAILVEPDTGHIPRHLVPIMIGVPALLLGAIAGLLFALVTVPANTSSPMAGKGRILFGAFVGAMAGLALMYIFSHSFYTIPIAALLGGALAARTANHKIAA